MLMVPIILNDDNIDNNEAKEIIFCASFEFLKSIFVGYWLGRHFNMKNYRGVMSIMLKPDD